MLEALNYVIGIVQPFELHLEIKKNIPLGVSDTSCKLRCSHVGLSLISTSKVVVMMLLVKWKQPKLTDNDLK